MHEYYIWESWHDGGENDPPEVYTAFNMESAVKQYIQNHAEDGLADSFTLWACLAPRGDPQPMLVRWRYELSADIECAS